MRRILLCLTVCVLYLLLLAVLPANAELYGYTDQAGRKHYVDAMEKIPEQFRSQAHTPREIKKVKPARQQLYEKERYATSFATVEVFVTGYCTYCRVLEKELDAAGIPYQRLDIEKDKTAQKLYLKLGGRGVPLTRVNGTQLISGARLDEIKQALQDSREQADTGGARPT